MAKTRKAFTRLLALAGLAAASSLAAAFIDDAKILIDRALNSPTLNIRYSGAAATMVELRINGVSHGTRVVSGTKASGETTFTLDLSTLAEGDNEVEVRLFDKNGKLVGSQKSLLAAQNPTSAAVRLLNPKMGATVIGPLEIKVGFGKELRNSYVSFFVNNQFRAMTNTPPYSYLWDTTREPNGWHELEAWVVDDSSNTFKSQKTKVFVNNPSGRTERRVLEPAVTTPAANTVKPATGTASGIKAGPTVPSTIAKTISTATPPRLSPTATPNEIPAVTGAPSGIKATRIEGGATAGAKLMTPSRPTNAAAAAASKSGRIDIKVAAPSVSAVTSAATLLPVTKGEKLPHIGAFTIMLNAKVVDFDVQPRVQEGIPLTPIRHLLEAAGGEVNWENASKAMSAWAEGREIYVRIGDKVAKINNLPVEMEIAPFLEKGRTIVPLSFIRDTLQVEIQFDPKSGHVLITSAKK